MTVGKILIIDDDAAFVELYEELLSAEGHQVLVAKDVELATTTLEKAGSEIDVVLIDQKLQGPGGPDIGLELLARVRQLTPFAKAIIVTGYSSPEAITRAFAEGVYDYLVKNGAFEALLKAKVRNAVEITSERRLISLRDEGREQRVRELWTACKTESDKHRKGSMLEELIKLLFLSTPGFTNVTTHARTSSEELDLVVRNEVETGPWSKETPYLLVECKNWSSSSGAAEYRNFCGKFETKFQRARAGFFVSVGGFTAGFRDGTRERRSGDLLIVSLDAAGIQAWIDAADRLKHLSDLHQKATLG